MGALGSQESIAYLKNATHRINMGYSMHSRATPGHVNMLQRNDVGIAFKKKRSFVPTLLRSNIFAAVSF